MTLSEQIVLAVLMAGFVFAFLLVVAPIKYTPRDQNLQAWWVVAATIFMFLFILLLLQVVNDMSEHPVRKEFPAPSNDAYEYIQDEYRQPSICGGTGDHDGQLVTSCDECSESGPWEAEISPIDFGRGDPNETTKD
jgi:Na+-transporting methylmalonyl-CoA/oxaloacetate decarboxylase gamma subunit